VSTFFACRISIEWNTFDAVVRTASQHTETTEGLLSDEALAEIEAAHHDGLTSAQIVEIFKSRTVKFSEATFRKYVQLGLLPRSRRVGRKGKHQGSLGLYPASTVRRINEVKRMMAESYTIEEIQRSFLRFRDEIEGIERGLEAVFEGFERELAGDAFEGARKQKLERELADTRKVATDLVGRLEVLERQVTSPLERAARARVFSSGASGGAGDLL
jgi:hypothetical protein